MSVNPDFRDLFAALNAEQVEFLIVGGYALAVHGIPRFTKTLMYGCGLTSPMPFDFGKPSMPLALLSAP
jgi:hypothetical protein